MFKKYDSISKKKIFFGVNIHHNSFSVHLIHKLRVNITN